MHSMSRLVSSLLALGCLLGSASAQKLRPFIQEPGVLEFSGEMMVRPKQVRDLERQGATLREIQAVRSLARGLVADHTVTYYPEVDEYIVRVPFGFDENTYGAYLMSTGVFQYATPNWICYPVAVPNDPEYPNQWHLPKIEAPRCWDLFTGSANIIVAICDTGCDLNHEDLAGIYVPGFNSASNQPQGVGGDVTPVHPHGTHVAGIVGAIGNNAKGVAGVNWNVSIMPIRVSNVSSGSASLGSLTSGARWAVDNGAKIINTSYSGVASDSIQTTGEYIRERGGLYFYAAGNDNRDLNWFDHADVVIVGATDQSDAKAGFSAYGLATDCFAPGVGILSTTPNNNYQSWNGTSMATPCAAGVAAMIWSAKPSLSSYEVEAFLYSGCEDLGVPGNDPYFGWGRVNVFRSVAQAISTVQYFATTGSYYERVTKPVTWAEANAEASSRSLYGVAGHLAVINSAAENTFIVNNLDTHFTRSHWLGGYQPPGSPEPAGNWRWVNNQPWTYTNWNPGEPNNAGGNEDSLEYWISGALGGWNDANGSAKNAGYIIEYPVGPPVQVSGIVTLLDYEGSAAGVTGEVQLRSGGQVVQTTPIVLTANGSWSIITPWKGSIEISVKTSHWLRKRWGSVGIGSSNVSGVLTSLINGDINGDNSVDIADYAVLSAVFGVPNSVADINGDGETDIADYAILSASFGLDGDN